LFKALEKYNGLDGNEEKWLKKYYKRLIPAISGKPNYKHSSAKQSLCVDREVKTW
jgi:hypothetical protein